MMSIEDAKRAVEINRKRESLIEIANQIRMSEKQLFAAPRDTRGHTYAPHLTTMEVKFEGDRFRKLLTEDLQQQMAVYDKQVREIGIEPDPFDAAAPVKTEEAA